MFIQRRCRSIQLLSCTIFLQGFLSRVGLGQRTIVSVIEHGSMMDIRLLPDLLAQAGVHSDGVLSRISMFLSTASIVTLESIQSQIVPTSVDSVSSSSLCLYLRVAEKRLPSISVDCESDTEMVERGNKVRDAKSAKLYVNDPDAGHQTYLERMQMPAVWDLIKRYPRKNVTVAVLDHGVDFTDPDMAPLKTCFTWNNDTVTSGGWNFIDDSPDIRADNYHGQYVSRILAARGNNSHRMIGIVPDHVHLVSLQETSTTVSYFSRLLEAIEGAIKIGADIISISSGGTLPDYLARIIERLLAKAEAHGIVIVSAAANEAIPSDGDYPCSYDGPSSLCVTSLNNEESFGIRNNAAYGTQVPIAAFGENIYVGRDATGKNSWYSGTSLSTPMVAGAAAILLSIGVEPSKVKSLLLAGSDPFDTGGKYLHPDGGALNILASVKEAISMLSSPSPFLS